MPVMLVITVVLSDQYFLFSGSLMPVIYVVLSVYHYHYYKKHLLGRVKTHFLGWVARPLLVLAAKNTYLQGRVTKLPLKTHL